MPRPTPSPAVDTEDLARPQNDSVSAFMSTKSTITNTTTSRSPAAHARAPTCPLLASPHIYTATSTMHLPSTTARAPSSTHSIRCHQHSHPVPTAVVPEACDALYPPYLYGKTLESARMQDSVRIPTPVESTAASAYTWSCHLAHLHRSASRIQYPIIVQSTPVIA